MSSCRLSALLFLVPVAAVAQARFDLAGPQIDVRVTRGTTTLPIARVPNLQPGDQLWIHPDFPASQSAHYLLVVSFLRGTTNPPPDGWFTRVETWEKKVREEGITVTVPAEAQQALLFLAPETGGDFSTLRSAVKGRPGVFVRASQDLAEAGFEEARIDKYLESMKRVPPGDAAAIIEHSNLLARTLNLRPNPDCFKRPFDQQYTCLTQTGTQALLDDGHAQSIVAALSTGAGSDFINQASTTKLAAGGNYSAYVGALVDLARLMNGLHVAQYQYIPAIAYPDKTAAPESLSLRLNTAPSFNNPKSVIVIGLPAVTKATLPPLRPAAPSQVSCVVDPRMVLPIEGAPLVFTTGFAHGLVLHVPGAAKDLALTPDAYQGGLLLAVPPLERRELPPDPGTHPAAQVPGITTAAAKEKPAPGPALIAQGTVEGMWGFDRFTGPALTVQEGAGTDWRILTPETQLIAGQANHLELTSTGTACVRSVSAEPDKKALKWSLAKKPGTIDPVDVTLTLDHGSGPGSLDLAIEQYGANAPEHVGTRTFSEPAKITGLQLHQGDRAAELKGTNLGQVKSMTLKDVSYKPAGPSQEGSLQMELAEGKTFPYKAGDHVQAQVRLNDDRTLEVATVVLPQRPQVTLLSRRVVQTGPTPIQLSTPDDLPLGAQLLFFLKSATNFPRTGQIEISGTGEDAQHTTLTLAAGTLVLQDAHTLLATFDPLKTFGPSTFGPFRLRALTADGAGGITPGEWIPLATIVRLPTLTGVQCPPDATQSCMLSGTGLYLIDAVSPDLSFTNQTKVPEGFVEPTLAMPRPVGGVFYVRLRDDLATTHQVTLPVVITPNAK